MEGKFAPSQHGQGNLLDAWGGSVLWNRKKGSSGVEEFLEEKKKDACQIQNNKRLTTPHHEG